MFVASQISTKQLEGLCRRLGMALEAGVDVRTALKREAERASGFTARRRLHAMSEAVEQGASLAESLEYTDTFFPEMFHAVVRVGEETGHLAESLRQLADHYDGQIRLRRRFLAAIAWPLIELAISVLAIGFLIWVLGVIGQSTGRPTDILGYGLVGTRGLVVYATFITIVAIGVLCVIHAIRRGMVWVKPVQRLALKLPGIGKPLETIALARLTWALNLTFNSGMDVRRALRLSLEATRNARFTDQIRPIDAAVEGGSSLYYAFSETQAFPPDFLDSLHAAEESGKLVESMAHLSGQYQDQAEAALGVLTTIAGFAVWALIAAIIIVAIFRLFSFYVNTIDSLTR
jgi:type II secretory pathway component PulF